MPKNFYILVYFEAKQEKNFYTHFFIFDSILHARLSHALSPLQKVLYLGIGELAFHGRKCASTPLLLTFSWKKGEETRRQFSFLVFLPVSLAAPFPLVIVGGDSTVVASYLRPIWEPWRPRISLKPSSLCSQNGQLLHNSVPFELGFPLI